MPREETFWNPYRMVPIQPQIVRKPPLTHEKFKGKNGMMSCELENLTPLFVARSNEGNPRFFLTRDTGSSRNTKPVIPGSSLKGMLRSLSETIGGGCFVTNNNNNNQNGACNNVDALCIACRMFGMMERNKAHARVHKGNINISDAMIVDESPRFKNYEILLAGPEEKHRSFYLSPDTGEFDKKSRKFYFHQPHVNKKFPTVPNNLKAHAWTVQALTFGHHFKFQVYFSNLRENELALLIYILALENNVKVCTGEEELQLNGPMRHKIGNAKPLGMGSCRISIENLVYFSDPSERFTSFDNNNNRKLEGNALKNEIQRQIEPFAQDQSQTMMQLRKMMVWDENDPRNFHYPTYNWFKTPKNSQIQLKTL